MLSDGFNPNTEFSGAKIAFFLLARKNAIYGHAGYNSTEARDAWQTGLPACPMLTLIGEQNERGIGNAASPT
jgi:hypothetical protein